MAVSAATVLNAYDFQQLDQRLYTDTDEYEIWTCKCDVEWTTTAYATANDATISPATAIQDSKRDGKTVTVINALGVKGYVCTISSTTTLIGIGIPSAVSANVITLPLTGEDWSTELTDTTALNTAVSVQPGTVQVTFKQKALAE